MKYLLYDFGSIQVGYQFVMILRIFLIPVYCECTEKLSLLSLDLKLGADLHTDILAVSVIDQILERNDQIG